MDGRIQYILRFVEIVGLLWVAYFYFSHNYDEYGILDRQYIGDIADCQNCLIIETKDSQYSYFFGFYNVIDTTPKTYYFRDEHKLKDNLLELNYVQSNPLIIKIHWHKVDALCCIRGVESVGLLH